MCHHQKKNSFLGCLEMFLYSHTKMHTQFLHTDILEIYFFSIVFIEPIHI